MTTIMNSDLQAQREYAKQMRSSGFDFSLTIASAFVRGIRDIGYKSTGTALNELMDNAIQAGAENVNVVLGFDGRSEAKPDRIAVLDDGHGMDPEMLRLSVIWGGTHRENDRTGFGRYGYGLPSASVSQGRRFTVYSKVEGGQLYSVALDLDDISAGKYNDKGGRIVVPDPQPTELPSWLEDYVEQHFTGHSLDQGTVVVIENLDRLSHRTTANLLRHLREQFGVIYRNLLLQTNILVQGERVGPVDPLFTTPGFRYYDLDGDRAEALEPLVFEVKDSESGKSLGMVKVRYSYMPPSFARLPDDKHKERGKTNARFTIMKEYNNGIIVLRKGRQIDVVTRCPWTTFQNNDRYWGVEIDFPPTIDEEFSITTAKQQVVLSERMWDLLKKEGVERVITHLRRRYLEDNAILKAGLEAQGKRASEIAMLDAEKFKTRKPGGDSVQQEKKSQERFQEELRKRTEQTGRPEDEVEQELRAEIRSRPYKVQEESLLGAPFFRVEQIGGQKVLYINTAHRFYKDIYSGPESTPRLRAALEVVLFIIGDCELDATNERQIFYQVERGEWSKLLDVTLSRLSQIDSIEDWVMAADTTAEG